MKKRWVAGCIAATIVLALLPERALAVETGSAGNTINGDYVAVINTGTTAQNTGILVFDESAGTSTTKTRMAQAEPMGILPGEDRIQNGEHLSFMQPTVSGPLTVSGQMFGQSRAAAYAIGDKKVLYGNKTFVCIALGDKCFVWMEEGLADRYSDENRKKAGQEVADMYGGRPSQVIDELSGGQDFYTDQTGKLSILIEEITGSSGFYAGEAGITAVHINAVAPEKYYVGAYSKYDGLIVHEAQHAMFRNLACQENGALAYELSWINEGLSVAAMDYYWGGDDPTGWLSLINGNLSVRNGSSLVYDAYRNSSVVDYSMPDLFIRYLANQMGKGYNPAAMIKNFYNDKMSVSGGGISYLNSVLQQAALSDETGSQLTFEKALTNFYVAAVAQENTGVYGFYGDPVVRKVITDYPIYAGESNISVQLEGSAAIILKTEGGQFSVPSDAGSNIKFVAFNINGESKLPQNGSGTVQDPYQITTAEEFASIASASSSSFRLMNDINVSAVTAFSPERFSGNFDGNGKSITGMTRPLVKINSGNIKNLTVDGFSGEFKTWTGVISNFNEGTISDCRVTGNVKVRMTSTVQFNLPVFGTMASQNDMGGVITRCSTDAAVELYMPSNQDYSGMIVGINKYEVSDCYALGSLTVYSSSDAAQLHVGGIAGEQFSSMYPKPFMRNCYSVTTIQKNGTGTFKIGQIAGSVQNESTMSGCYGINASYPMMTGKTDGAAAKTDAELRTQTTFDAWQFGSVWQIAPGEYPAFYQIGSESITASVSKQEYYKGETLSFYQAYLNVGSGKVPLTEDMVQAFDSSTAGIKTIQGNYKGNAFQFQVTVKEPGNVSALTVYTSPRTSYTEGELFTAAGTRLRATIDGKENIYLTSGYEVDKTLPLKVSDQKVKYSYGNAAADMAITVASKTMAVKRVNVVGTPKLTGYYIGDPLNVSGLKVQLIYTDGSKSKIYSRSEFAGANLHISKGMDTPIAFDSILLNADHKQLLYVYYGDKLPKASGSIYAQVGQLEVKRSIWLEDQIFQVTHNTDVNQMTDQITGIEAGTGGGITVELISGSLPNGITLSSNPTDVLNFAGKPNTLGDYTAVYKITDKRSGKNIPVAITFQVKPASSECEIRQFIVKKNPADTKVYSGIIDHDKKTVSVVIPSSDNVTVSNLYCEVLVSPNAVGGGTSFGEDFTNPKSYIITAEDHTATRTYTAAVTISTQPQLNVPTDFAIDEGMAVWKKVDNADNYLLTVFYKSSAAGMETIVHTDTTSATSYDFSSFITKKGIYGIRAAACSADGSYINSPFVTSPATYTFSEPVVRKVSVQPANLTLHPGETTQLLATTEGVGAYSKTLIWTVTGNLSMDTKVTDGKLEIAADEASKELTVRAISAWDAQKYADVVVTIADIPRMKSPTGLKWTGESGSWNAVDQAEAYKVTLFKDFQPLSGEKRITATGMDFGSLMTEDGIYTFRVQAAAAGVPDSEAVDSPVYVKGKGEITGVTINEKAPTLKAGDHYQFTAAVSGTGTYNPQVQWSVEGNKDAATQIDANGLLSVSQNQKAAALTIKAAAAGDPSKSATVTVTIADQADQGNPDQPDQGNPDQPDQGNPDQPDQGNPEKPDTGNPGKPNPDNPQKPGIDDSQNANNNNGNKNSDSQDSTGDKKNKSVLQSTPKKDEQKTLLNGAASEKTSKNKKAAVKNKSEEPDKTSASDTGEAASDNLDTEWEKQPELTDSAADENKENPSQDTVNQEEQITEKQNQKGIYILVGVLSAGSLAAVGGIAFYRFRFKRR